MRCVVQRITRGGVRVDGQTIAEIDHGLALYVGVGTDDDEADVRYVADKVRHLRIFADDAGLMNRNVADVGGAVLAVSAFTVQGDARKGRRPSFVAAAAPEQAAPLFGMLCACLEEAGLTVARGQFGAHMEVETVNDGPICILLDSKRTV